jgi:multiple sugar transport system permease protein
MKEIRRNWQNYALMAPFLILFALFTLIPIVYSVVISFTNFNIFTTPTFVGWDNYLRMFFDDDVFIIAIRNTLIFALITGPVSYVLCFVFAWLINELRPKVRAVVTLIFYAPVLSGTAFTVWSFIFSSDAYGLLNGLLMNLGILREPVGWLTDPACILFVVIFVQLWMSLGTGFLSFIAGLQGVDRTLYEAGLVDGVHNRFQELWYITLPVMKP